MIHPTDFGHMANLTKREFFAALAMQGILSEQDCNLTFAELAVVCVKNADALIAELAKEKP